MRVITAHPYHALFAKTMFIELAPGEAASFEPTALVLHTPDLEADPGRGRHAHRHVRRAASRAHRAARRRHVLRGRDQEVDLHRHERPAAARRRLPDALLGERRRRRSRRGLLRPLRHRQDDALRRPGARADRRRRARLGRQRRLQHRRRLLREGDPPVGGGRARDLRDDAHLRDDPRERRDRRERRRSTSTTTRRPRTPAPRTSSSRSRTRCRAKRAGHPVDGDLPDRRRVRDPAADREAHPRPGALLLPLRLHGQARRHGDRRHRAAADVLDVLRPAVPAAAAEASTRSCSARSSTSTARRVWLVNTGWTGGPFGEGSRMPIQATRTMLRAALSGRARRRRAAHRPDVRVRRARRASPASTRSCSTRARPGATPRRTTARRASSRALFADNFATRFADVGDAVRTAGPTP